MCGIAAIIAKKTLSSELISEMTDLIHHRGPDDEGFFFVDTKRQYSFYGGKDTPENVLLSSIPYTPENKYVSELHEKDIKLALGHRRLSILDLSPAGHLPMSYSGDRYWITYNGEVYNYIELKEELRAKGYEFRTNSDTEVILAAYQEWGTDCLHHFNGMWAFVIYDQQEQIIFAARDRFGIKPLYYWVSPDRDLCFASEIKQFTALPGWQASVNPQRAYDFLVYSLLDHTDETMFQGVFHIPPGCFFKSHIDKLSINPSEKINYHKWYTLQPKKWKGNLKQAAGQFKEYFDRSVNLRLRADVEVGSCLSGGLDSSSIVCTINNILKEQGSEELQRTFSACSHDKKFDERKWIDIVVNATKVKAHYTYPSFEDLIRDAEKITWHQDEPYQSNSILMQWNVFKLSKQNQVTVMLDGQGADEQLAGYLGYLGPHLANLFIRFKWFRFGKEFRAIKKIHGITWNNILVNIAHAAFPKWLKAKLRPSDNTVPAWLNMDKLKAIPLHPFEVLNIKTGSIRALSEAQLNTINLQKLLHWEDRNSMAHSIESRVPFLDHRLVEFVVGLPDQHKILDGITKKVLRVAMEGTLPSPIINRMDKIGFIAPEETWIKKHYTEQFKEKLKDAIQYSMGIFNENLLLEFEKMLQGLKPFDYTFWRVISFAEWMKTFSVNQKESQEIKKPINLDS